MKLMKLLAALLLSMYIIASCSSGSGDHEHAGEKAKKKEHAGVAADEKSST